MTSPEYFLRQNVIMEPLFNQWYAWSHLISPATAAMNIANSHLKLMKSYVSAPQIHANALKNPAMLGGPFIDYQGGRVGEIKGLLDRTTKEQAHLLEFAASIKTLNELLLNEAKGYSLEPLYAKVPENLKGFVELVYDLNNNPSIRFFEGLLYRSRYYDPSQQSIALSLIHHDDRAFALATPRLPDDNILHLRIPFNDVAIDELFRMRDVPQSFEFIKEMLRLEPEQEKLFSTFLTVDRPESAPRYTGEDVRLRYYGHACISVETKDVFILTDPVISYAYNNGIKRYTHLDLPDVIDYVVITHAHQDHIMFESLLQLRHKVKTVIVPKNANGSLQDPSLRLVLQTIGFKNVVELGEMETLEIEGGSVTGLPFLGEHADLNVATKLTHLVKLKGQTFLFAADTNNIEPKLYQHVYDYLGDIDVLFLGMECDGAPFSWLYGPLVTRVLDRKMDQSRRLDGSNYEKGIALVNQFNCKEVYVYAMGQEPWLNYVMSIKYTPESNPIVASNKLVADCRSRGIVAERLFGQKERIYSRRPEHIYEPEAVLTPT
ncbi:MAG TPA: MBL fold metallo-hydrolase [Pyrinomonadaceae bacterium]|nr:MBL fold metallo-hydrolase [Pyrinomonadaceae bacterium]